MMFVGFVALLLILSRYVSIKLSPSAHTYIKEVPMKKTLTVKAREVCSIVMETFWAIGASGIAGHLAT
jgi:hypothetical protein